jgi:hypothetical protein
LELKANEHFTKKKLWYSFKWVLKCKITALHERKIRVLTQKWHSSEIVVRKRAREKDKKEENNRVEEKKGENKISLTNKTKTILKKYY